jgi:hypothetical protein
MAREHYKVYGLREILLKQHTICFFMRLSRSSSEISPSCKSDSHKAVSAKSFSGPVPHLAAMDNPKIETKYLLIMSGKGWDKI